MGKIIIQQGKKFGTRLKCCILQQNWNAFLREEDGIGTVEMILILVVLIGLVLIFKEKLNGLVKDIFKNISEQAGAV